MKRFRRIVLPLVLVLILFVMPASAAGSGTLSITADKTTLNEGDVVTITLGVKDNPGIITLAVYAEFDNSVFEVVQNSKSVNGFLDEVIEVNDKAGFVGFDLGNDLATEDVTTSGTVAAFQLRVKKDVYSGDYKVGISFSEAYDKDIKAVTFDAPSVTLTVNGAKCDHQMIKTEAVAAACEKAGNTEYFTCSICHRIFEDETGTKEITQASTVLAATGHSWDQGTIVKTADNSRKGQITFACTRTDCGETKIEEFDLILRPEITELTDVDAKGKLEGAVPEGYIKENVCYKNISIKVSVDNGVSYVDADKDTMPVDGLSIEIPYPDGIASENYDFTVFQVRADDSVQVMIPEKTANGLLVTVKDAGALAIGYKEIPVPTPTPATEPAPTSAPAPAATSAPAQQPAVVSTAPLTGETGALSLYLFLAGGVVLIVIVGVCLKMREKRKHNC